jgi:hypothetical protein
MSEQKQSALESRRGAFTQFIVGAAGALLYTTMSLVWPKPHPQSVLDPGPRNLPGIVGWLFRLPHLLGNYYVQLGHIYRLCLPRGVQTQRPGCVDLCVLVGLGFPGACLSFTG